ANISGMKRTLLLYSIFLAFSAFLLEWLEYKYFIRAIPTELYIFLLAAAFMALGLWIGAQLTSGSRDGDFRVNEAPASALGLTLREREVLSLIAEGQSNKEIARSLGVSPNTVKTHLANLYSNSM
ncbi:MAG: helix-turn-helix transcriptional regulator, partial [Pseudomonadota bacterium]